MFFIYTKNDIFKLLNDPLDEIPTVSDFTLDVINLPISVVAMISGNDIILDVYYRDRKRTYKDKLGSVTFPAHCADPDVDIPLHCNVKSQENIVAYWSTAALQALKAVEKDGLLEQAAASDEKSEGILLKDNHGIVSSKIVEGKHRPALACTTPSGDVIMYRPYKDEN